MPLTDISAVKKNLRAKYKDIRTKMPSDERLSYNRSLFLNITSFEPFLKADTVFCFVSTDIEVDTHLLISHCFKAGKKVAVPKCLDNKGTMDFFYINSFDDLNIDSFGILEPDISKCSKADNIGKAVCIVPGFTFDNKGYRIGFGKGYYDRFLSCFNGISIGICYHNCIADSLPHDKYDITVDYIVTEKGVITALD